MIIGIYCRENKPPTPDEFLTPFVDELLIILNNGIIINGHKINIRIRCFICDTPARSFIKGNKIYRKYLYLLLGNEIRISKNIYYENNYVH